MFKSFYRKYTWYKKGLKHFELDENWKTVLDELKERIDGNK